jgi:hypothetical protein
MDESPRGSDVPAHIESVAYRGEAETRRLMFMLRRHCWPGGSGDRSDPVALEWVRRWGPKTLTEISQSCSCPHGRCTVCN